MNDDDVPESERDRAEQGRFWTAYAALLILVACVAFLSGMASGLAIF